MTDIMQSMTEDILTDGVTSPFPLNGLVVNLDASNIGSITTAIGNAVSQIDDLTGNSNHGTQGDGGRQPDTATVTIGGLNALAFTDDQLIVPNNANDDMDIFIICRPINAANSHGQWWGNSGLYDAEQAGGTADFGSSIQDSGLLGFGFGPGAAGGDSTAKTPGSVLGADHMINLTRESIAADVRQIRVDGSLEFNGTTGNRRNTRNAIRRTIGSIQTNANYMLSMYFGQLLVYNRILSAQERADVETFLSDKWGTP